MSLSFVFRCPISEVHFPLYELNSWIGGFGDRVFVLRDLAFYQPSFDGLWSELFPKCRLVPKLPAVVEFEEFNYQNLDQLTESTEQREEVQRVLGFLALSIAGGCSCSLYSTASDNMMDFSGEIAALFSNTEAGIQSGRDILIKYGLSK